MYRRTMVNPARVDRDDEKRMLPCRYFLSGFCQKGSRCKFFHPNMHAREPFIRVPDLPSSFSMVSNQHGRLRAEGFSRYGSQSRPRTGKGGWQSSTKSRSATSISPRSRRMSEEMFSDNLLSPSSHAYSQYQMGNSNNYDDYEYDDEDEDSDGKSRSRTPKRKPGDQYTMFNHIDWSEFLAPGVAPPVPTEIPGQGTPLSPHGIRPEYGSLMKRRNIQPLVKDMPPEGSSGSEDVEDSANVSGERKLTAKEELQLKVKNIAQELADEPIPHVRSLDSFFRNFKFNGYNVTAPGSARSFGPPEENEGNKENAQDGFPSGSDNKPAQDDPSGSST